MLITLKEIRDKNIFASVYTNGYNTSKFLFGKVLYVDAEWFVMYLLLPDGNYDGIMLKSVGDVFRIELDSCYNQRMQKLMQTKALPEIDIEFQENALMSLLNFAQNKKQLVSLELLSSGEWDVIGKVDSVLHDICVIKQFDVDGNEDGKSYISIKDITQLSMGSQEETIIQQLIKGNQGTVL